MFIGSSLFRLSQRGKSDGVIYSETEDLFSIRAAEGILAFDRQLSQQINGVRISQWGAAVLTRSAQVAPGKSATRFTRLTLQRRQGRRHRIGARAGISAPRVRGFPRGV